jgi:twinkle protein
MNNTILDQHIPCDDCGSSDAKCTYEDGHSYCFSCLAYTPPPKKEFNTLDELYSYEYLPIRGITKDTLQFYDVKTKIDSEGKPRSIGFPYPNSSYKIRLLDKKAFHTQGDIAKAGLFGRNKFTAGVHKYVTITEGELDALSLYQVLRSPVVSVRSSVTAQSDCALDRSWLNSFERIYLAFDNDEPGRAAADAVAKLFDYSKVYCVRFPGGARKDANDYLRNGERDELAALWWNAKKYLPESIVSSFIDFDKIIREKPKQGVPYPFPTLNYMTYGIRTGESVLITAQEGVGKTEVMHAIEHQLSWRQTIQSALSSLKSLSEGISKQLPGYISNARLTLPDSGVSDEDTFQAVQDVVRVDERLHIYSHFGSDDPEVIIDTIRFLVSARGCRYILLDHITMVVSGLGGKDERTSLDYLSTRLEMMVKELDFALVIVSHVNDDGLTRGSRNISKIADIRLDLYRDVTAVDPIVRRITRLVVSKNRFCGRTGPAGELLFDPVTYTLTEDMGYGIPANDNGRIEAMAS